MIYLVIGIIIISIIMFLITIIIISIMLLLLIMVVLTRGAVRTCLCVILCSISLLLF